MSLQLPAPLISSLKQLDGFDESTFIKVHQSGEKITSVRLNPRKLYNLQSLKPESLNPQPIIPDPAQKIPWSSYGYYLSSRPSFTADPLFHAGAYYVQEASSMFLEEVLRQTCDLSQPLKILDLCASPGGKSTLVQSLISSDSLLVSNEVIKTRVNVLIENTVKSGAANVVVSNNDAKDFQRLPSFFDVVIVDAPCSGSGLFRKDNEAITEWSEGNVQLCSRRQQRILADILPSLKHGGILIYSTCSYSPEEDELIVDKLQSELIEAGGNAALSSIRINIKDDWNIIGSQSKETGSYGYRFYPDKLKGEGFFIAALKKNGSPAGNIEVKLKNKVQLPGKPEIAAVEKYINTSQLLSYYKWENHVTAIPGALLNDLAILQQALYIKKAGIVIGTLVHGELIPDHELAMSNLISEDVPFVEVDYETAMQFLRRAIFQMQTPLKGWALVKYEGLALGWVKIMSNRVNNYYPKGWRILNK